MRLTRELLEEAAAEYERREPLAPVEAEQLETLGDAYERGDAGWRDFEWPVRWYYRRSLGDVPNDERREREAQFGRNDFEAVASALEDVLELEDDAERIARLTDLEGVDVSVASAFLTFLEPEAYLPVGEREWAAMREAGEVDGPYPDPPSTEAYVRYLERCRSLADRLESDPPTLYRALWRLSGDDSRW